MERLINKWNQNCVNDEGPVDSKEFIQFKHEFRHALRRIEDWRVVKFSGHHHHCDAFLKKDDHYILISYDVPRHNQPLDMYASDPYQGILYGLVENDKDYKPKEKHYTNFPNLVSDINKLIGSENNA